MAISISIPEAASQFAFLVDRVKQGEEVTILEAGVAIARLVRCPKQRLPRIPGQDQGKVQIAPDFNAPLPEDNQARFSQPCSTLSMRVLLDTHAFIWWVTNDSQRKRNKLLC